MDPIIIKYPSKFSLFKRKRKERLNELSLIQKCEGCGCKLHITSLQQITCHATIKLPYENYPRTGVYHDNLNYWKYSCPYCNIEKGKDTLYPLSSKNVIKVVDYIKAHDDIHILSLIKYYEITNHADGYLDNRPFDTYRIICLCNVLKFAIPDKVILSKHYDVIEKNIINGNLKPDCLDSEDCRLAVRKLMIDEMKAELDKEKFENDEPHFYQMINCAATKIGILKKRHKNDN